MTVTFGEKRGKRTSVYIDGELTGSLYPGEVNSYSLEDEGEISEADYERLVNETLLPRAKRYTMNLLIKSDKTETELKRKLRQAGYGEAISDAAIEYVRSYHYIDELRTAESYIRSKMDFSSEKEIRYKLSEKGIDDETVDLAYDQIIEEMNSLEDAEESTNAFRAESENTELRAAINFVRKKLGSRLSSKTDLGFTTGWRDSTGNMEEEDEVEAADDEALSYEDKQKIMAAAFRKGFRQESIRRAFAILNVDD